MPADTRHRALTHKEARFVDEYTGGDDKFDGTNSAIRAGYSAQSAYEIAHQLKKKPHIKAAIEARMKDMSERCAVNVETITRQLYDVYELAMCGAVDRGADKLPGMATASPAAAVTALMSIAKLHGLVVDKKADTTPDGKPLPPAQIQVTFVRPNACQTAPE